MILWGRKVHLFSSPFFCGVAIKRIKVNRYYLGDCSFANIIETSLEWCALLHKSSGAGELPPYALTDPYVNLSIHTALIVQPLPRRQRSCLTRWLLPSLVDQPVRPNNPTPSLHLHYRDFITTTSWSAPVLRIGTFTLMGPPFEFFP